MNLYYNMTIECADRSEKGGSLKRSLGMVSLVFTIPKAFGFEAATPLQEDNRQVDP